MKHNYELIMESAKKWEAVLDGKKERGIEDCPLCRVYNDVYEKFKDDNDDHCCMKCPIYKETNKPYCQGTPYETWVTHQNIMHSFPFDRKVRCKVCEIIVRDMINFLKKLAVEWKNKK